MNKNLLIRLFENRISMGSQSALLDFDSGCDLTWSEIWATSLSVSQKAREAAPDRKYFVCVTKDPTLSCLFLFGSWLSNVTPILVNPNFTRSEIENVEASLCAQGEGSHSWLCDETTNEKIKTARRDRSAPIVKFDIASLKNKPAEAEVARESLLPLTSKEIDALGLFTSGSTQIPKLVKFSHHNLLRSAEIEIENDKRLQQTTVVNLRPHFTSGGCNSLWPWVYGGGRMIFSNAAAQLPNARIIRNLLFKTKPELLICSPSMLNVLAESNDGHPLSDVPLPTYFGGMSVSETVLTSLVSMGLCPWMRYGMTEVGHIISKIDLTQGPPYPEKSDVGQVYRGLHAKSDSGYLVFRGDGIARSCVAKGADFVSDDRGEVRGARIILRGRENKIANVNGFRFPIAEVQRAMESHRELKHVLALAIPNGFKGDEIVVFFQPNEPGGVDEIALRLSMQNLLVNFKRPNRYILVHAWPFTANGKVNQAALMDLLK
ncbi:MAG: acyl--CoA ligase [Deltaproteobacteria bacterium]|jgi:acyl-CoA synthetase (AMP-forming)/AMP-acid ligase II|nr:acyl--CoA ligase [Deltaproteobacteria bacterium]